MLEEQRHVAELINRDEEEAGEEVDMGRAPPTGYLSLEKVPAPWATLPAATGF